MAYGLGGGYYGGGGSVGGSAAAGIQSGFQMGRQLDEDADRRAQRARDNARQDEIDAEHRDQLARANTRQDKADSEHEDDRQFQAANTALDDTRYQLGVLHQKYPDGNIPDSEAKPLYDAVGQAHSARQALIAKRYQPVIDATTQKWRDFASKAQVGQADPSTLRGQDLRDFIKATTGHDLSEFANGNITGAVNDATTGIQTNNQGMTIRGAGVLLGPQVRQGLGATAPDGSQIVDKSLYALVPAPRQPLPQATSPTQGLSTALDAAAGNAPAPAAPGPNGMSAAPAPASGMSSPSPDAGPGDAAPAAPAAAPAAPTGAPDPTAAASPNQQGVPDSDPSKVIPVLQVTSRQPDGSTTTYHAPVTKDRGDPNSPIAGPIDTQGLMDRMGRLGVVDNWLKTPEMAGAVQDAMKDGSPTSFEQAWGMVHGDPKALSAQDPTSLKIAAIKKLQKDGGYDSFDDAARALGGRNAKTTGLQAKLDAIDGDDSLSDGEKADARRVAVGIAKVDGKRGLVGVKGGGAGGGAPGVSGTASGKASTALGGAAAPDPKTAPPDQVVDFWSKAVLAGDKDWQVGLSRSKSGSALIEAVKRRVPGMAAELGLQPQDIGTSRATNAALGSTLKDLTKRSEAVDLFSSKLQKDMAVYDNLLTTAGSNSPLLINKPMNQLRRQFSDPSLAQLDLSAQQVGTEYERLITGGTLSVAQLHGGAQEDAHRLLNGDMTPTQARATMKIMNAEIANARSAAHESTARVQNQMRALGNGPLGGVPPPTAAPPRSGTGLGAAPAAAAPRQIANDADFNALPSGAEFIAPDGSHRRKP